MKFLNVFHRACGLGVFLTLVQGQAQEAVIEINADQVLHPVSRHLTGACIEDVNHEVYGGIYSQMIFGESFQEPAPASPLKGFTVYGGRWVLSGDSIEITGGDGPKIISDMPALTNGEVNVEIKFSDNGDGNASIIVNASEPGSGPDEFNGYEVALEPSGNLVLGRHRHDWEFIRKVPCNIFINEWNKLAVRMTGAVLDISVNGRSVIQYEDKEHPLSSGTVGLRVWHRDASFRNLSVNTADGIRQLPFEVAPENRWADGASGMWRPFHRGAAVGGFAIEQQNAFAGAQSQRITFTGGTGEIGIGNQGLNHWGMNFVKNKSYEGYLWARADEPAEIFVGMESGNGEKCYAEKKLVVKTTGDWQRLDFTLTPDEFDTGGQFVIKLKKPGSIIVGQAFLQPGKWGRFKDLPVRKDVAEGLINQGVTVLRYGGSMVNHQGYRWKKMIGPRDRRPPYTGTWYPHSSNGWGILDFLDFCEAAGFLAVPDLNAGETPQDMADFVEYVNGSAESEWGRKRAAAGHPKPYHLKYVEIGNEESVNDAYFAKFKPIAEAIWAKDPGIIPVVGDFAYGRPIKDPFHFTGAAGAISSLAVQQKIMQLAKQHDAEVWFDVHVWTEGPRPGFGGTFSYIDAMDKIADGARHHVVVFELNANNHSLRRALANAAAINTAERDGRLPIVTSANCLQPDGQNENGWDQGLLFLNPSQVWLQPPGYVTQIISRNYQPLEVASAVHGTGNNLDISVKRSDNGKILVLQAVNFGEQPLTAAISLHGFAPFHSVAQVEEMGGALNANNTAMAPERVRPYSFAWREEWNDGRGTYTFPPQSLTVIKLQ